MEKTLKTRHYAPTGFAAAALHKRNAIQRGRLYGLNVIYGVEALLTAWEHLLRPTAINQRRRMLSCNGGC